MKTLLMPPAPYQAQDHPVRRIKLRERQFFRSAHYQDTCVSKRQDIWLLGPPQCGKSSAITRLMQRADSIWLRWPVMYIQAQDPLARWFEQKALQGFVTPQGKSYESLGLERRLDALLQWCQAHRCVWLIDDAHTLGARKLNILMRLLQNARVIVIGALSEQSMPPSLRTFLQRRGPQVLSLSSEAPYDATLSILWLVLLIAISAGWWELAAALSAVRGLGRGPLATRQR
jgi:AAA domain